MDIKKFTSAGARGASMGRALSVQKNEKSQQYPF